MEVLSKVCFINKTVMFYLALVLVILMQSKQDSMVLTLVGLGEGP